MAVKLPDTLVPMADFPSAFAKDVQFTDGENLQDKLDKGKLGSSSGGTGLTEEQANNIEKIPSIEGIVTSNSQDIANKADKDHEHTEYLKEIPDEYVIDTELSTELDKKVNKEVGKGLSTNDLTDELVIKINSSATEAFVTNAIANAQLDGGDVDLSGYATVDALNLKADLTHTHDQYLTEVPDEYITETELTDKNYADKEYVTQAVSNVKVDLTEYAKTSDIPTKVSQLTNDSNFITTIPEEYITETELANELSTRNVKTYTNITQLGLTAPVITGKIYNALPENSIFQCEIVDNKTVSDTPENTGMLIIQKSSKRLAIEFKASARYSVYPNNLYLGQLKGDDGSGITWNKVALSSDLEGCVTDTELSSKGYATETFVTTKITEASLSGGGVDLSGYATKDDVPTKTSELTNDSGFITTIPEEYITETELETKGYLTEHQDISDLALKSEIPDVSSFVTSDDLPTTILDDLNIANDTTYSSYRLDTLLKALKNENIEYCNSAISGLNKLSKEIITDKSQITNENTIYLLLTDSVNNIYEQWLLINGTPYMIGTTEAKLNSVYTKDEADDRYALLTDFNILTTSFNDLETSVEKKIDKNKIVTALDNTVTDEQVPSAKAVNDILSTVQGTTNAKIYYQLSQLGITTPCTIKDIWDKMPSGSIVIVNADSSIITDLDVIKISLGISGGDEVYGILTVVKLNGRTTLEFRRARTGKAMFPDTFIGYCKGSDCTSISWKQIAFTTGVADVGVTTITPVNSAITGTMEYIVKNGICYVSMKDIMSTISSTGLVISTTMPKSSVNCSVASINTSGVVARICIDKNTAKLIGNFYEKNGKSCCSFSYPVAE